MHLGTSFEANESGAPTDHLKASWVRANPSGPIHFDKSLSDGNVHAGQPDSRLLIGMTGHEQLLIQRMTRMRNHHFTHLSISVAVEGSQEPCIASIRVATSWCALTHRTI
jgi:hypothetical protein